VSNAGTEVTHREISADERWALLERILNSRELKRALRLRELLLYIGSQSLKSGVSVIREHEIGAAVFGRSAEYDTSLDNIVRVNVTELRKRLCHYFEEEGARETILVEIPRGNYIPVFCRRPIPIAIRTPIESLRRTPDTEGAGLGRPSSDTTDIEPEDHPAPPVAAEIRTRNRSPWLLPLAVTSAFLLCGVIVLLWQNSLLRSQLHPWQSDPLRQAFWSEFFGSGDEVDIVTADTSLSLAVDLLKQPISLDDYLDYKYKTFADLPGLTPATRNALNLILDRNLGSVGDFQVVKRLLDIGARSPSLKLASARAYTPERVKTNNVILIGSRASNPWVDLYKDRMNFSIEYDPDRHHSYVVNRAPESGELPIYELSTEQNRGLSVVAFLPNLSEHRYALIIEGTDSQATLAAGEWITSDEGLAVFRQHAPKGRFPFFEVLLKSSRLVGTPLRTEVTAIRVHSR
jgi:hypothetical protein